MATKRQLKSWDRQVLALFQRTHRLIDKMAAAGESDEGDIHTELINATLAFMDARGFIADELGTPTKRKMTNAELTALVRETPKEIG